jgi:hypothetical protein
MDAPGVSLAADRYQAVDEEQMVRVLVNDCWHHEPLFADAAGLEGMARRVLDRWVGQGLPTRYEQGRRVWPLGIAAFRREVRTFKRGRETLGRAVHSPARFLVKPRRQFNVESYPPGSRWASTRDRSKGLIQMTGVNNE